MSYPVMIQHEKDGRQKLKEGHVAEAESCFRAALAEAEKYPLPNAYMARQIKNLAVFYCGYGDYEKAESLLKRSLAIERSLFGAENLEICKSLNHLGLLYQLCGNFVQAETVYRQALQIVEHTPFKRYPEIDSKLHDLSLHLLAIVCCNVGKQSEAENLCEQAAAKRRDADPRDRETHMKLHDVAVRYCDLDTNPEAREAYEWLLRGFAENLQQTFLGSIVKGRPPSLAERKQQEDLMQSIYELLVEYDEVWRPARIYHEENLSVATSATEAGKIGLTPPIEVTESKSESKKWRP
jgi:tetratricopeptide (TPR) repeat protein